MEFYDVIDSRRTVREFLDKEVDFEAIRRILEAGNKAPTWNHNRNWSFIILRTDEEKEFAFEHAKKIADKFDADKYLNTPRPYPTTLAQKMYAYAIWIACNIFISQRLKRSETVLMFRPLFSAIISTIVVYLLIGDHPFHFETLLDYRVWIIAAAAVAATCVIMTLGPQKNETYKAAELMEMCVEAACMEIPQRAMMQTFVLWLLEKWDLNPICCILINALIWCAGILFQAVVIQKQSAVKKLTIELISSFVFSIGVGYVFYTAGCILLPMAAHASERFLMNYHRKTIQGSTE